MSKVLLDVIYLVGGIVVGQTENIGSRAEVIYEDEIDLRDLLRVIWRYRALIIGIILASLLFSAFFSFLVLRPVYEVNAQVSLGYMASIDANPLYTNPNYANQLLSSDGFLLETMNKLHLDTTAKSFNKLKQSLKINVVKETNVLQLSLETEKPEEGKAVLATMIDIFSKDGNLQFERQKNLIANEVLRNKGDIAQLEQKIKNVQDIYASLITAGGGIAVDLQRAEQLNVLSRFEDERWKQLVKQVEWQQKLNSMQQIQAIQEPLYSPIPIKPHKMLNLAVAGLLGLIIGIFVAFIFDYFRRNPLELYKD